MEMNADLFLLLIPLLYFLFELFGQRKTGRQPPPMPEPEYRDPILQDFPKKVPQPLQVPVPPPVAAAVKASPAAPDLEANVPAIPEQTGWQDKLQPSLVINGVIFAEILQPPRAMRPLEPRFTRRR